MKKIWFAVGAVCLTGCSSNNDAPPEASPPQPVVAPVQPAPVDPYAIRPGETVPQWELRTRDSPQRLAEEQKKAAEFAEAVERGKEQLRREAEASRPEREQREAEVRKIDERLKAQSDRNKVRGLRADTESVESNGGQNPGRSLDQWDKSRIRDNQRQIDDIQSR